jgi:hypothetical protein
VWDRQIDLHQFLRTADPRFATNSKRTYLDNWDEVGILFSPVFRLRGIRELFEIHTKTGNEMKFSKIVWAKIQITSQSPVY